MQPSKVLIVGGAGYIGSSLVSRILTDSEYKVVVLDDLLYGGESLFSFFNFGERFQFLKGDLRSFNLDKILDIF